MFLVREYTQYVAYAIRTCGVHDLISFKLYHHFWGRKVTSLYIVGAWEQNSYSKARHPDAREHAVKRVRLRMLTPTKVPIDKG